MKIFKDPKEIELPSFTKTQSIACAILFAQHVCKDERWNKWATNWLNGTDRTEKSATIAFRYADYTYGQSDDCADPLADASYATFIAYGNDNSCCHAIHCTINAHPDTFTLETITNIINKALEY